MRKYIFILTAFCVLLTGCGEKSPQETQQAKREECFGNTDLLNCDRIDFIFYSPERANEANDRVRFSYLCKEPKNINMLYTQYEYFEAVLGIYTDISMSAENYSLDKVSLTEKSITEDGRSHYVQIKLDEPLSIKLGDETLEDVSKILYDAESGNFFLGDNDKLYTTAAVRDDTADAFSADLQMLYYIEGYAEPPKHDYWIEELYDLLGRQ